MNGRVSPRLRALGVLQADDPRLSRRPSRAYDLPREAPAASRDIAAIFAAMSRIADIYAFPHGMGLAAPQLGLDRSVAAVRTAEPGTPAIVLFNPSVLAAAADREVRHERCLSFFDVRGLVPRPRWIEVEHDLHDGGRTVTRFEGTMARLVAHQIDHVAGVLYTARMRLGSEPDDFSAVPAVPSVVAG